MQGARVQDAGDSLPDRLRERLADGPVEAGDTVVVAISGGLDSVALLHLLRFPLRDLDLVLRAAHLDHAMRPGSAGDAAWVRGLCTAWDVPLGEGRLDPPAGSEADARARRYAFLDEQAPDGAWVLTAHHRDDQAETVLFRAIRGTGVRGLRGIAPRRGRVLRPLLPFGRAELRAYGVAAGLGWRVDPTNRDVGYARNRLRHEVMPALERVRPGTARSLARLAERARATERAWSAALERLEAEVVLEEDPAGITLARGVLRSYHPELRARVLRHVLRRYGSTPDRAGTQAALEFISSGPSGGELHVSGGVRLERDFDRIRVAPVAEEDPGDAPLVIADAGPGKGRAVIGGRAVDVEWGPSHEGPPAEDQPEQDQPEHDRSEHDRSAAPGPERDGPVGAAGVVLRAPELPLTVRGWRPGDRIRFGYGTKKLTKLFVEKRMGRRARRRTPLVVDASGRVLWVAGVARAEGVGEDGTGFGITVSDVGGQR